MTIALTTRESAVQWLNKQGLYAATRDWSLGETIMVAEGQFSTKHQSLRSPNPGEEIIAYRFMLYIHPDSNQWSVSDLSNAYPISKTYKTLEEATHEAAKDLLEKLASEAGA